MARRAYVPELHIGENRLPTESAHHVRNVLRLQVGDTLHLFTPAGLTAAGELLRVEPAEVIVAVATIETPPPAALAITVAAALPKGERADWMIEKLSELGVARFVPLAAERSVVLPAGSNKLERWRRIAVEAARQSQRPGVMQVDALTPLPALLEPPQPSPATLLAHLSTMPDAPPLLSRAADPTLTAAYLFVGPEGGWTPDEITRFETAHIAAVRLTRTILRVETAAVTAAALLACSH